MGDVTLSEDEYARLKAVVVEAYALRDYLDNVRKTVMRIMPFHIEMPELRHALNEADGIDMDNPRTQNNGEFQSSSDQIDQHILDSMKPLKATQHARTTNRSRTRANKK